MQRIMGAAGPVTGVRNNSDRRRARCFPGAAAGTFTFSGEWY